MIKSTENDPRQVQVESLLPSSSANNIQERQTEDESINNHSDFNETSTRSHIEDDDYSSLEKSFVVLSSTCKVSSMDSVESNEDEREKNEELSTSGDTHVGENVREIDDKSNSSQGGRRGSLRSQFRKSTSFLAKLQPSSQQTEHINSDININLPSSIANAFSSISSFGSSFSFNANPNGNNNASSLTIETASTSTKQSQITESKEDIFIKRAALERKNLINLTKLIVKDLISSSLVAGRTIENCHNTIHLNNYFVLIDRVLKHGLKQQILSNKSAGLWTALENLPKFLKESTLMSESVRSLAHTKTPDGKIKAWIRLAMMQKKLPEYFSELLANKDALLKDIYYDYAFMLNDEAHVFAGLIIGVNVIDCNYFVKDANFDIMDIIIDLSPYLRAASSFDDSQEEEKEAHEDYEETEEESTVRSLTKVLDQKNYLEEFNKRLQSTIDELKTKIKDLSEQNSKLEMESKVNEIRIKKLISNRSDTPQTERQSSGLPLSETLKNLMSSSIDSKPSSIASNNHTDNISRDSMLPNEVAGVDGKGAEEEDKDSSGKLLEPTGDLQDQNVENENQQQQQQQQIADNKVELQRYQSKIIEQEKELTNIRERVSILETSYRGALEKIKVLERDLDVQASMNSDRETTIQIYEKDIREKQNQVESLRASMNDARKLNSELTERLNDTSAKLKDRISSVSSLQASLDKWKLENKTLANHFQEKQLTLRTTTNELNKLRDTLNDLKRYNEKINDELKKERECGQNSSVTVETQNARIAELADKLATIEKELNEARPYRDSAEDLKRRCQEYEQSLEEVGSQLKESRLEVESLKENSSVFLDSQWLDSRQVKNCALCQQTFSVTRRKHHCRLCGNVFCQQCSDNKMELASSSKPVRVCDTCHAFLLAKFVKSSNSSQANSN